MMDALDRAGYEVPSPVQGGVIPVALEGKDVLGQARTGTGKTAAFVIPILERLQPVDSHAKTQALIVVPTRELAVQVHGEFEKLAVNRNARCVVAYGGQPIRKQILQLENGAPVVVGTPGRLLDHIQRRTLDLSRLQCVVLDEADRMLDIGFREDIEKILRKCPQSRQTLLLSATVPPTIERLCKRYMREPTVLNFSTGDLSVKLIEQFYFTVDPRRKFDLLKKLLDREKPEQAIVFCRTKRGTEKIFQRLSKSLKNCGCMHGDMPQSARNRMMASFRAGKIDLLVATDVVGRGIDVSGISHIINYDLPQSSDDYVHRVGRTGRMGKEGVAYSFVTREEGEQLTNIEMLINRQLIQDRIEGHDFSVPEQPKVSPTEEPAKPPPTLNRRKKRHRRAL